MSTALDARRLAFDVLLRVEQGAYADLSLDATLKRHPALDPRDRALTTELVYGTLRLRGRLDFALRHFCNQPLEKIEHALLTILRLTAYQMLHLERIPAAAAVNSAVELTRAIGLSRATGFVNGILRSLARRAEQIPWPDPQRDPLGHLTHRLSLPGWLAERWLAALGAAEAALLAEELLLPAPFTVRVNTLCCERTRFVAACREAGHRVEECRFAPDGVVVRERGPAPLPGDAQGWYQVQDEASQLIPHLLAPQAGERILDACAAPGGKTTAIAALTGNRAAIVALDLHPQRLELVRNGARRLGCSGIDCHPWDLTTPPPFLAAQSFDRILLDAPCSGLGVLRRNPESRWRRTPADLADLAARQSAILENLAPLLRPGGVLLYSLCTDTPEETTQVVTPFLQRHPDFVREDLRDGVPAAWHALCDVTGALKTLPHRHAGMDGFFAVRLRREG